AASSPTGAMAGAVAKAYGCLATPHVFIFDAERKLRYKGQFDDSRFEDASTVKSQDARYAIEALLAGKAVPVETTKPHGCSTKWLGKKELVAQKMEKWDATPVDVALLDVDGAAALRKNGTKKVRLFNIWATWCGPCVAEFPELVNASRKFGLRDFEMITISTDAADTLPKVKAFLEKRGAGLSPKLQASVKSEGRQTNSYLFEGSDLAAVMKVLDPEWPGAIPHTVLVGTAGESIWRHNGPVNGEELQEKILTHLGAFYKP
ncbi:MAG: TlpA family protein disulfide reductase, partial [Verrucomicrobiota bacterium]